MPELQALPQGLIEEGLVQRMVPGMYDPGPDERTFREWAEAMSHGDFGRAWQIDIREQRHWPSAHRLWQDEPFAGEKVAVYGLHGLGDIVHMLQYAPRLQERFGEVTYVVPRDIEPLMRSFTGVTNVTTLPVMDKPRFPTKCIEMMELPFVLRTLHAELPLCTRYLDPDGKLKNALSPRMPRERGVLRVGLAWEGSTWDIERWISPGDLAPLFAAEGIEFWPLQGAAGDHRHKLRFTGKADAFTGGIDEFAGLIANLDLVITIDSLSAHLAGALGVPAWVLLKQEADWRWLRSGESSGWYPSARLFRQPRRGDWSTVIAEVAERLGQRVARDDGL